MEPPPKQTDPNAHPWRTVTENAEAQLALTRALDSGRWTAAELVAVLEGGPVRREPGPPTPEEILEAGERLAGMVEAVLTEATGRTETAVDVRFLARRVAGVRARQVAAASSRSPG